MLRDMGLEVMTAHDGLDGLEKAAAFLPQAVFLDLGMPKMDGIEAAKRLRTQPEGRHATIIALTGWGQEQDFQRTRAAGFDHHLLKPIDVKMIDLVLRGDSAVSRR